MIKVDWAIMQGFVIRGMLTADGPAAWRLSFFCFLKFDFHTTNNLFDLISPSDAQGLCHPGKEMAQIAV